MILVFQAVNGNSNIFNYIHFLHLILLFTVSSFVVTWKVETLREKMFKRWKIRNKIVDMKENNRTCLFPHFLFLKKKTNFMRIFLFVFSS